MDRDHELTAVLADDTRYRIYRAIAEQPGEDVTVAQIATRFDLHPNVARMHLTKLEQAGFLVTGFQRGGGGGRPAKLYRLSDMVVTFGFPPRRYELLSRLALDALAAGGSRGDAVRTCREAGAAEGRRVLSEEGAPPRDVDALVRLVAKVAEELGLLPEVGWRDEELRIIVHNCTFRELLRTDPDLVCAMHRAFMAGLLEVVGVGLGRLRLVSDDCRISLGGESCEIVCAFALDGEGLDASAR